MTTEPTSKSAACGSLAIAFFLAHLVWHAFLGDPENALWACHVASLIIGIGGITASPAWVFVGLLWLVVGIPLWFYHLAVGGPLVPTSLLTHFGGAGVGCVLLNKFQPAARKVSVWWRASFGLLALVALTRLVTTREANINLAFDIHGKNDTTMDEHVRYLLAIAAVVTVVFFLSEIILRRVLVKSCDTSSLTE